MCWSLSTCTRVYAENNKFNADFSKYRNEIEKIKPRKKKLNNSYPSKEKPQPTGLNISVKYKHMTD